MEKLKIVRKSKNSGLILFYSNAIEWNIKFFQSLFFAQVDGREVGVVYYFIALFSLLLK